MSKSQVYEQHNKWITKKIKKINVKAHTHSCNESFYTTWSHGPKKNRFKSHMIKTFSQYAHRRNTD